MLFRFFEQLICPTEMPPDTAPPACGAADGLLRFYWHYARQIPLLILALFVAGLLMALCDTMVPVILGRLVGLVSAHGPAKFLNDNWPQLAGMAFFLLVIRPAVLLVQSLVTNQTITAGVTNLVRWQSHWHVVRQSWMFFQNDFAGRVAHRVMETGPSLRESIVQTTNAAWYIVIYGSGAILLLASSEVYLALPIIGWFFCYALLLYSFVPQLRARSSDLSTVRSALSGRIVDIYSNILTVKLFAKVIDEDAFVREGINEHTIAFHAQLRATTCFSVTLAAMNACLVVGTGAVAVLLWDIGRIQVGTMATALPLAWQIANLSTRVAQSITGIFGNVGTVLDGMKSIAEPRQLPDASHATTMEVTRGAILFEHVRFGYTTKRGVLNDVSLNVCPGERVGIVGRSGAGKSTLVNLLLRLYAPEGGRIVIDGQDIADVTQESLRSQIAMVAQDTSLLNRSIGDNIRYGRPGATEADVIEAARKANAADFIAALEDWQGRRGFDAHVGERGVKLSGGQRQRIAIARAILKNAAILILDEATAALDSEVEAAIQDQLERLMIGRTVIAIAHRLSTIARMDRLVVLEEGRIVEQGTHRELLSLAGQYANLWRRQSGGFIAETA